MSPPLGNAEYVTTLKFNAPSSPPIEDSGTVTSKPLATFSTLAAGPKGESVAAAGVVVDLSGIVTGRNDGTRIR